MGKPEKQSSFDQFLKEAHKVCCKVNFDDSSVYGNENVYQNVAYSREILEV